MCGLCGVFSTNVPTYPGFDDCARLQQHRGPDHFGHASGKTYSIFHNRLSIIDTSDQSNQPFEDETHLLVYNGEIYNYIELAADRLNIAKATSDVQVLFELLKRFGQSVVPDLDGMFSFVFYDKIAQTILCARDRLGIKPLYWSVHDGSFFFASELKSMIAMLGRLTGFDARKNASVEFVNDTFALGYAESQNSPYGTIHQLYPGATLVCSLHNPKVTINKYFEVPARISILSSHSKTSAPEKDLTNTLDTLIRNSIKLHLRSDVPLGVLCSGGVDSSLITAMVSRIVKKPVVYHACFRGKGNELPWAEKVARHLNLQLNHIEMDATQFLRLLPLAIWHNDLPMYHPNDISLYAISERAKKDGIKVLLCGEGADELFGGYPWYRTFRNTLKYYHFIRGYGFITSFLRRALRISPLPAQLSPGGLLKFAPTHCLYSEANLVDLAFRSSVIHNPAMIDSTQALYSAYKNRDSNPALASFIGMNLSGHLSSLLHRNDRMGMMASIETRVPFLENDIIDFAINLDSKYKIRGNTGKYLLKKVATRYLPGDVVYRRKQGFPVPWKEYLSKCDLSILKEGFLTDHWKINGNNLLAILNENKQALFTALSIEIWARLFLRKETTDSIVKRIAID